MKWKIGILVFTLIVPGQLSYATDWAALGRGISKGMAEHRAEKAERDRIAQERAEELADMELRHEQDMENIRLQYELEMKRIKAIHEAEPKESPDPPVAPVFIVTPPPAPVVPPPVNPGPDPLMVANARMQSAINFAQREARAYIQLENQVVELKRQIASLQQEISRLKPQLTVRKTNETKRRVISRPVRSHRASVR